MTAIYGLTDPNICPSNHDINVNLFLKPCDESFITKKILEKKYIYKSFIYPLNIFNLFCYKDVMV